MNLQTRKRPFESEAASCGRWIQDYLKQCRKKRTAPDDFTIYYWAKWAGHWGRKALA